MNSNTKLNFLPTEIVNQIAAGEVIERPSSVVKELVDNSIDAGATKISIRLRDGGISLIEVSDNGIGIPKENLADIFLAHTTTKLQSIDDLNSLLSMGFRGEALSTIVAVANVNMISKYQDEDIANEIVFNSPKEYKIKSAAKESGTTISVRDIFGNIPVRKKYLKTARTEYQKVIDILTPYFLIHSKISWEVYKDGKKVLDLQTYESSKRIDKQRAKDVLKKDFIDRMETLFFEGNGIRISGLTAHPSDHMKRTKFQYIFVNSRSVWDSGIAKAVVSGYERYIPHGEKVPFIVAIDINPDQVDINVHPRKEEVKFLNPYRVYSSVEQCVSKSIEKLVSYKNISETPPIINKDVYRPDFSNKSLSINKEYSSSRDITFGSSGSSVKDSLIFSKAILENDNDRVETQQSFLEAESSDSSDYKSRSIFSFHQIFNKYIIVEFENEIWMIDQHAAAERITFEKLSKLNEIQNTDIQNLLVPIEVECNESEKSFIEEHHTTFLNWGFDIELLNDKLLIRSIPVEFVSADISKLFTDIFEIDIDESEKDLDRLKLDMVATMACHTSIRSGQKLDIPLMQDVYYNLLECDNPYSCPHGRPIVWKLKIEEIDHNFDRTY